MVESVAPRNSAPWLLTQSIKPGRSVLARLRMAVRRSSINAPFKASHISWVMAVRMARALARAYSKQLMIDDGLSRLKIR